MNDQVEEVLSDEPACDNKGRPCRRCGQVTTYRCRFLKTPTECVAEITCNGCRFVGRAGVPRWAIVELRELWGLGVAEAVAHEAFNRIREQFRQGAPENG